MTSTVLIIEDDLQFRQRLQDALATTSWSLLVLDTTHAMKVPAGAAQVMIVDGLLSDVTGYRTSLSPQISATEVRAAVSARIDAIEHWGDASYQATDLRPAIEVGIQLEDAEVGARRRVGSENLDPNSIDCVFHEIVPMAGGPAVGYEALTRFADGLVPQERFTVAAERGWGPDLEFIALLTQLREAKHLPEGRWLALNVSPTMLLDARLAVALAKVRRPIVLELTEHEPIGDYDRIRRAFARLPGSPRLSIDDAGAGYACLSHVLALRPAFVKLDRLWIDGIAEDPARQALVGGIRSFTAAIDSSIIAEGVERPEDQQTLVDLGVDFAQGFLISRPAQARDLARSVLR